MNAREWCAVGLALALGLAFNACGDDDDSSGPDPFGNAASPPATYAGSTASNGGTTGTNTGSPGSSGSGGSANGSAAGSMSSGMGFPGGGGTESMAMCPATQPENDSECMGRRLNCTFGVLECRCRRGRWSCENDEMDGPPDDDGMDEPPDQDAGAL